MINGIITAIIISACWIILQNVWMQFRPAKDRIAAMTIGYIVSLPFLIGCYAIIARLAIWNSPEPWGIGLFHAILSHFLIFLLYVECFYHIERSITLRFLVEILRWNKPGAPSLKQIQGDYNIGDMIERRLQILSENQFIKKNRSHWILLKKGLLFARAMSISCWIFQSETQDQRIE